MITSAKIGNPDVYLYFHHVDMLRITVQGAQFSQGCFLNDVWQRPRRSWWTC